MHDSSGGAPRPHDPPSAQWAAVMAELEAAFALARASARTLAAQSPETRDQFRGHLRREIDRLKLAGPGAPELALMKLREFTRD
ncbi:MAG: hypothetical protein JSR45_02060 [Proteobacteria bacterium]|nr:hypothetical protein [Pseudomonadota bacterium]